MDFQSAALTNAFIIFEHAKSVKAALKDSTIAAEIPGIFIQSRYAFGESIRPNVALLTCCYV